MYERGLVLYDSIRRKKMKKNTIKTSDKFDDDDFFDDCPVCQFTKTMQAQGKNPTMSELQEVFRKANEKRE